MREANKKKTAQPACQELGNNFYLPSDSNVELHNSSVELLSNTVGSTDALTLSVSRDALAVRQSF